MNETELKMYTVLSSFTEKGMSIFGESDIPKMNESELKLLANYYSVIFGKSLSTEGLYGPLPVAYHTEYLLYVFTFTIKNSQIKDERLAHCGYQVPSFLLILFPTTAEPLVNKSRDKILTGIKVWKAKFTEILDINQKQLDKLNSSLIYTISIENNQTIMTETDKISLVLSKSIELLYNVSNYNEKPMKILLAGTDENIIELARDAFLSKNAALIRSFSHENELLNINLGKINYRVAKLDCDKPNIQKYLSNDLVGVMYFANFSNDSRIEAHSQQLEEIIKNTNQNCLVSFAISQTTTPTKIEETKLPEYLSKGVGRTISLLDLANENMNIGRAIIESLDKLVDVTVRGR